MGSESERTTSITAHSRTSKYPKLRTLRLRRRCRHEYLYDNLQRIQRRSIHTKSCDLIHSPFLNGKRWAIGASNPTCEGIWCSLRWDTREAKGAHECSVPSAMDNQLFKHTGWEMTRAKKTFMQVYHMSTHAVLDAICGITSSKLSANGSATDWDPWFVKFSKFRLRVRLRVSSFFLFGFVKKCRGFGGKRPIHTSGGRQPNGHIDCSSRVGEKYARILS